MADMDETAYTQGSRRAWLTMLRECLRQLGYESSEVATTRWAAEREEILLMLREVCRDFGDNDWPDDLHLSDVIEKHLARHLHARGSEGPPHA